MTKHYRILFETYEPSSNEKELISRIVLMSDVIKKPTNIFDFGFTHDKQVELIQSAQNLLLEEQISLDESEIEYCPHCPARHLVKYGKRRSNYHDVFTVPSN